MELYTKQEMLDITIQCKETGRVWNETHLFPISAWDISNTEIMEELALTNHIILGWARTGIEV
jgi:hypothetical protein